jgi:hypothetical protein
LRGGPGAVFIRPRAAGMQFPNNECHQGCVHQRDSGCGILAEVASDLLSLKPLSVTNLLPAPD